MKKTNFGKSSSHNFIEDSEVISLLKCKKRNDRFNLQLL